MIVGVERANDALKTPDVNIPFEEGDIIWVVGENDDVYKLVSKKRIIPHQVINNTILFNIII